MKTTVTADPKEPTIVISRWFDVRRTSCSRRPRAPS